MNVAPEFGLLETRMLLSLYKLYDSSGKSYDNFIEISYESEKWKKWMLDQNNSDKQRSAYISGHYVFNDDRVKEIKEKFIKDTNIEVDKIIQQSLKVKIIEYFSLLNYI